MIRKLCILLVFLPVCAMQAPADESLGDILDRLERLSDEKLQEYFDFEFEKQDMLDTFYDSKVGAIKN